MPHEHLWAPWRLSYIRGDEQEAPAPLPSLLPGGDGDCFLCRAAVSQDERRDLVVGRGPFTLSILNRYPYNNGHLLVAPLRHVGQLSQLTADEHLECAQFFDHWVRRMEARMRADGFNLGLNLGRVAGAGVPGHLHWHIVPRWNGDTNFMPVTGDTKVIPQALDALWQLLTEPNSP